MRFGIAACVLAFGALAVWGGESARVPWMNHDAANALYVGQRVLDGDRLYVDWLYFVPPPIVQLSAAACAAARLLSLSPPTLFHLLVVATALLGAVVLRGARWGGEARTRAVLLAYLAVLAHASLSPLDFGQREHLFALLFVPYFVWRLSGARATPATLALLVYLGFLCVNKPHFAAAVGVSELFWLADRPRRAAVWGALCLGALAPFALLALDSRESFAAFFGEAVPYHLGGSYARYDAPLGGFLASGRHAVHLVLAGALLAACLGRRAWAVAGVGALLYLSVLQQHKFYDYHSAPFLAFAFVLAIGLLFETVGARRWARAALLAVPLLVAARGVAVLVSNMAGPPNDHVRPALELLPERGCVLMLTHVVEGGIFAYALVHELELVGPWSSNYTVVPLLEIDDPEERTRALRDYFAPIAARIAEMRPELVIFSPFKVAGTTLHRVFVHRMRLFPTPAYRFWKRTRNGWMFYRRSSATESPGGISSVRSDTGLRS